MMRLPALAGRSFMRRWPRLIISIVLCAVFFILFLSPRAYAQTANQANSSFGLGSGGTRNISGNNELIVKLEKAISRMASLE